MATRAPPPAGLPAKVTTIPPNQTLYVTNLPSAKIQKDDLRTALYMLFSEHGAVLDVVALKTREMRGQAHIVYRDVATSTQAMRSLDGFELFGRPMKISYAKSRSNIIAKLDGSFKSPQAASAGQVEVTDLQQSIFNAPVPGSAAAKAAAPAAGATGAAAPAKPDETMKDADGKGAVDGEAARGTKRAREEADASSDSDVAMEEESDED